MATTLLKTFLLTVCLNTLLLSKQQQQHLREIWSMGNCVGGICKSMVHINNNGLKRSSSAASSSSKQRIINVAGKRMRVKIKKKKGDEDGVTVSRSSGSSSSGRVRIKVVMSQKELMKMVNDGCNYISVHHLLNAINHKNTSYKLISSSSSHHENGGSSSWKPTLDSITEDV